MVVDDYLREEKEERQVENIKEEGLGLMESCGVPANLREFVRILIVMGLLMLRSSARVSRMKK